MVVSGCASQQAPAVATVPMVATASQANTGASAPTSPASATVSASTTPVLAVAPELRFPPVKAGRSVPGNIPFTGPDGRLADDIQAYAIEVAQTRQVPLGHVESLLQNATYDAEAARLMSPSKTRIRRSWVTYRKRFVDPIRTRAGVEFWQQHRSTLDAVTKAYGVPQSVIVAIIGVETVYGRYTGSFRVLDALATLGFRYPDPTRPERDQLFRDQLADLILLDYQGRLNAREVTGSFAGAMGLPQFMPGSLLRYAADGDGDGRITLGSSTEDAITSVARFLRLHGWVPGLPVFAPVNLTPQAQKLVDGGLEPTLSWQQLQQSGATARVTAQPDNTWQNYPLGVVNLVDEPRNTVEYRTGTPNFFAITHYNRSYFYASSVADLANTLAERLGYGRAY